MIPSQPAYAESISLEEAHRAAGVADLTRGRFVMRIELIKRDLSSC